MKTEKYSLDGLNFGKTLAMDNLILNVNSIYKMKAQKKQLENKIALLKEEEKILESDIQKLEDPSYVARYAREKYLYSKDGEIIIRMPDDDE